jgi:hypothetical protein
MIRTALALFLLLAAAPAAAERVRWYAGEAGLVIGDLGELTLADTSTSPPTPLSTAAVTLTAWGTSGLWYELAGLPDAAAGSGDSYALSFERLGAVYAAEWPLVAQSLQPQAVSHQVGFVPTAARLELAAGDLLPFAEATVVGLTSDPTGAAVTFTLLDSTGTAAIDAAAAELADATSYVGHDGATRWRALLRYRWATGDTDDAGDYTYSFRITFPGSPPRPLTIPPPRSWPARIY